VGTDVVVGADVAGAVPQDQHGVVENLEADVVTRCGDILHATRLQPDLAPQPVALGPGVLLGNIGLDGNDSGLRQLLLGLDDAACVAHCMLPVG